LFEHLIDEVGFLDGDAVSGGGDLFEAGTGNEFGKALSKAGQGDGIVFGTEDEGGNIRKGFQLLRTIVFAQGFELFHENGRLIGEVAADEGGHLGGELLEVCGAQVFPGHEHFEEGATAHGAGTDAGAEGDPKNPGGEPGGVLAAGEGAEEGKAADAFGAIESELLGDDSAHGMAHDVRGVPASGVEECAAILRHGFDGDDGPGAGKTFANAAIVEEEGLEIVLQSGDLGTPGFASSADALDEEYGWTFAGKFVVEIGVGCFEERHWADGGEWLRRWQELFRPRSLIQRLTADRSR
jgi:hypothetical protein